jgi:hypothetical protein
MLIHLVNFSTDRYGRSATVGWEPLSQFGLLCRMRPCVWVVNGSNRVRRYGGISGVIFRPFSVVERDRKPCCTPSQPRSASPSGGRPTDPGNTAETQQIARKPRSTARPAALVVPLKGWRKLAMSASEVLVAGQIAPRNSVMFPRGKAESRLGEITGGGTKYRAMMSRTAIAQIAKIIGRELESGLGPSEEALAPFLNLVFAPPNPSLPAAAPICTFVALVAAGPTLADAGATTEIARVLLTEARRKRPDNRMIEAYTFVLEGALATLQLRASGGDVGADDAIAEVRNRLDDALQKGGVAHEVLMLVARAFARAELDPGQSLQEAVMSAMETPSPSMTAVLTADDIYDHFTELAAAFDNDPFEIYVELATTAAAFPA